MTNVGAVFVCICSLWMTNLELYPCLVHFSVYCFMSWVQSSDVFLYSLLYCDILHVIVLRTICVCRIVTTCVYHALDLRIHRLFCCYVSGRACHRSPWTYNLLVCSTCPSAIMCVIKIKSWTLAECIPPFKCKRTLYLKRNLDYVCVFPTHATGIYCDTLYIVTPTVLFNVTFIITFFITFTVTSQNLWYFYII